MDADDELELPAGILRWREEEPEEPSIDEEPSDWDFYAYVW